MKFFSVLSLSVAATAFAAPVMAASISISSIDGVWQNASDAVSGNGTNEIRWGDDIGFGQSGYDFVGSDAPLDASDDESFVLGVFDHRNLPVRGTFLDSVDLAVSFAVDGVSDVITSVFSFDHLESYNQAKTCANGQRNRSGVNAQGCADRVMATLNTGQSESFEIGGVNYILDILGFQYQGELLTDFWTMETAINSAELLAEFRVVASEVPPEETPEEPPIFPPQSPPEPTPEQPPEVPLPASGFLLLGGLAALVAKRRLG